MKSHRRIHVTEGNLTKVWFREDAVAYFNKMFDDSRVPFGNIRLTMLLQDSFEDDKSTILMLLCANPDLKELCKTVYTLEYGAEAKCIIIRAAHASAPRDKMSSAESSAMLDSRIVGMNQFIHKASKGEQIEREGDA
jgi:kinesin family member 11